MTGIDAEVCPMPSTADAPGDTELARVLARTHNVAVVGASPNPDRTSHQIAVWLMENTPYEVFLVNPRAEDQDIRGHGFFPSLADLPVMPDLVDVFRRPEEVPPVARDAIAVGAATLWMQLGIRNDEAAQQCLAAGLTVIQNRCIKVEYHRLRDQIEVARAVRGE
jgi:predicted CoA-binding protein